MHVIKTEVISRKREWKAKKKNLGEGVAHLQKGVEKFDGTAPSDQNKGNGCKAGATGLQGTIVEVNANGLQGTQNEVNACGLQ